MSKKNSTFTTDDSCPFKEETYYCLDPNSIPLRFIKDETPTHQNIDDNNQSYCIENNVPEIKIEKDDRNTGMQNSIFILEDPIKTEIDIKEEMLTYLDNDIEKSNTNSFRNVHRKQYKCDICKKPLTLKAVLRSHMLTHTGKKQHKCNICQKLFILKGNLNTHILTHTGERQHKCNICQKSFSRKYHLSTHMVTHTGEKPYSCNICQKSFSHKSKLNTHKLTHTG